jgi:two-component system sensor histidine kinase KdpD
VTPPSYQPRRSAQARRRRILLPLVAWALVLTLEVDLLRPWRDELDPGTIALLLLPAPLLAAVGGRVVAVAAAVVSAMVFNFVFTVPYNSMAIEDPASIVAFVTYIVLALTMSWLLHRLVQQRAQSDSRARDALLLRDLSLDLATQSEWLEPPLRGAIADLRRSMLLDGALLTGRTATGDVRIEDGRVVELAALAESVTTAASDAQSTVRSLRPDKSTTIVPIRAGDESFGLLAVHRAETLDGDERRVLEAFTNVVAIAMQRARLVDAEVSRRSLEETDRLRIALLQSVTHDLRTPLTAIRALAGAMLQTGEVNDEHASMLRDIEVESDRLSRLVNGLLDLSRIEGGALNVAHAPVDLGDVVRAVLATPAFAPRGSDLSLDVDAHRVVVDGDETLLHQVVTNLVDNALRHGAPPVELSVRRAGTMVEMTVRDHGPGVAPPERERLFVADPRRRTGRSMGIGLQVTRGFVDAHGGSIDVTPTPGGGTTFMVRLPAALDHQAGAS